MILYYWSQDWSQEAAHAVFPHLLSLQFADRHCRGHTAKAAPGAAVLDPAAPAGAPEGLAKPAAYPFAALEAKWQRYWLENKTFRTPDLAELDRSRPKFYVLDMCVLISLKLQLNCSWPLHHGFDTCVTTLHADYCTEQHQLTCLPFLSNFTQELLLVVHHHIHSGRLILFQPVELETTMTTGCSRFIYSFWHIRQPYKSL